MDCAMGSMRRLVCGAGALAGAIAIFACQGSSSSTDSRPPSGVYSLPSDRATTWKPGIPDGIPTRTTVCATVDGAAYGDGAQDATAAIQAAIDACSEGQVVSLSAGTFAITRTLQINKGIVLRGAGPRKTLLTSNGFNGAVVWIGPLWPHVRSSVDLAADGAKGATSITVANAQGFTRGTLAVIDELSDPDYVQWSAARSPPGDPSRGWFSRMDRPVGQMVEIASVSGNTITLTSPLRPPFRTRPRARLTP